MISLAVFIPVSGWGGRQIWHTFAVRLCHFGLYWCLLRPVLALPQPDAVCHRAFCAGHCGSDDGTRRASGRPEELRQARPGERHRVNDYVGAHRACSRFARQRFSHHLSLVALDILAQHPD